MADGNRTDRRTCILIPLDGSEAATKAIPQALRVAAGPATLILLHVTAKAELPVGLPEGFMQRRADLLRQRQDTAADTLGAVATRLRQAHPDVAVDTVVDAGDPAERILRTAEARGADLIVMATRDHTYADAANLGSVALRVALKATIPVMIVRPEFLADQDGLAPIRRLLVPLDGSHRAARAIPVAIRLAHQLGVPIEILTVIDPNTALPPALAYGLSPDCGSVAETVAALRFEAHEALRHAEAAVAARGVRVTTDALYGPVAPCLECAAQPDDVIVMATHGQARANQKRFGSVAARLIRNAPVPVIVLRGEPAAEVAVGAFFEDRHLEPTSVLYY